MATWKARISGDDSYIQDLKKAYGNRGIQFERTSEGWLISGDIFKNCSTDDEVRQEIEPWLNILNGGAALLGGCGIPVSLNHILYEHDDGHKDIYLQLHDEIKLSIVEKVEISKSSGDIEEFYPAKQIPQWLDLASRDSNVRHVLELISTRDWSWVNLYRIFEVIRADVGGGDEIVKRGWMTKVAMGRFTHSANHPEVAGPAARHGHLNAEPPSNPMDIQEAGSVISALAHQWIAEKLIYNQAFLRNTANKYSPP